SVTAFKRTPQTAVDAMVASRRLRHILAGVVAVQDKYGARDVLACRSNPACSVTGHEDGRDLFKLVRLVKIPPNLVPELLGSSEIQAAEVHLIDQPAPPRRTLTTFIHGHQSGLPPRSTLIADMVLVRLDEQIVDLPLL